MKRFISLYEAVQRPENYLQQIEDVLYKKETKILKLINTNNIEKFCIGLSTMLKSFHIRVRYEDSIIEFPYMADNSKTAPDKHNTIYINVNKRVLNIGNIKQLQNFFHGFLQVMGHEIIHRMQYHKKVTVNTQRKIMNYTNQLKTNYMFSKQEIMAFAWDIIEEFRYLGYNTNEILNFMKNSENLILPSRRSIPLNYYQLLVYYHAMDQEDSKNKLHKYMYEYLEGDKNETL